MKEFSFYICTVKKLFSILGITFLTLLYCAAISMAGDTFQNSGFSNKVTYEKGNTDKTVSIKLFSNTSQAESLANPFSNSLPTTVKDSKDEFFTILKIRELFFANEFSQYIFSARNFLIKYGKVNIIFPFHYFW